jgi:hypothetical protein
VCVFDPPRDAREHVLRDLDAERPHDGLRHNLGACRTRRGTPPFMSGREHMTYVNPWGGWLAPAPERVVR